MNSREFLLQARVDSNVAMAPIFDALPWLLSNTLEGFVPYVAPKPQIASWDKRVLQNVIADFHHRAGTLTPEVGDRLLLITPGNIVRLSHQPNLFAYMKLIGQFVALEQLSDLTGYAPLFYFIDYDIVGDHRFGRCDFPDPLAPNGFRQLRIPKSSRTHRTAVANRTVLPPRNWFEETAIFLKQMSEHYSFHNMTDGPIEARLSRLLEDLEIAFKNGRNLAEMTAILLSRYVNLWLRIPIPFVPGSAMWGQISTKSLASEIPSIESLGAALQKAHDEISSYGVQTTRFSKDQIPIPFWWICDCGSRVRLEPPQNHYAVGICGHCQKEIKVENNVLFGEAGPSHTAPRIILHNILNRSALGYVGGVSHIGSAEHVIWHSLAMTYLQQEPIPQWLWECTGNFETHLEQKKVISDMPFLPEATQSVQAGNASFAYFALCKTPESTKEIIERKLG